MLTGITLVDYGRAVLGTSNQSDCSYVMYGGALHTMYQSVKYFPCVEPSIALCLCIELTVHTPNGQTKHGSTSSNSSRFGKHFILSVYFLCN